MFTRLGKIIEHKPYYIILIIIIITLFFSIFAPSLQFKTDFSDFSPNTKIVKANNRITDYFGSAQQAMFLLIGTKDANSVLSPESLQEQYRLEQELLNNSLVNSSISIVTFLDIICQSEFNTSFKNCTNIQIKTALNDLLNFTKNKEQQIFKKNDPDESVDYKRFPRLLKQYSIDSADIKNCFINSTNKSIIFSIEVYNLSSILKLKPPFSGVNIMEWYIGFNDILAPKKYQINYQIAARIEPMNKSWIFKNGLPQNIKEVIKLIKNHSLFNTYEKNVYLWIKTPQQEISIPVRLDESNVTFNVKNNRVVISASKTELGDYGIAPEIQNFYVPAKLSNFTAGVRYYKTPVLKRPGGHIAINSSFLFNKIDKLTNRTILGPIFIKILQKYGGISLNEINMMKNRTGNLLPNSLSFEDISSLWTQTDYVPNNGSSSTIFPLLPNLFKELKTNTISLLSKDYEKTKNPQYDIIILQIKNENDINKEAKINTNIVNQVNELNKGFQKIHVQATGEGVISAQINKSTGSANEKIIPSIFIIIIIVLFINFRKPSYVFLPVLVFLITVIWLFGTMALLKIPFSIISVALIPILIGLGVEYSVNLFVNYKNELASGKNSIDAIKTSLKEIGVAIFMAWLTTFIAFFSFITALLPPVRNFGVLLALGITYTFIVTMTLMITIRYLIDKKKNFNIKKGTKISVKSLMNKISYITSRHKKIVFTLTIIVTIFMVSGLMQLKTGFSMDDFIPQDNNALELLNKISNDFPSASQNQQYILIEGDVATVATLKGISQTTDNFKNDDFIIKNPDGKVKTDNINSIIQEAIKNNKSLISKFNIDPSTNIPKTNKDVQDLFTYLYSNEEYSQQVKNVLYQNNGKYKATVIRVYLISSFQSSSSNQTNEYNFIKTTLNSDLTSYGNATAIVTGSLFITYSIMTSLTESQILSTSVSFILAIIILILIFRIPSLGAIAMIPVSLSIIWVLGTMYFIGYTLNVLTITVTSITIGAGVNYAIYITQRFRLVALKTNDPEKTIKETISRTGSAVFIAAVTSMLGFGVLVSAPSPPQVEFGLITSITLFYAFLTSIFILPLVLAKWAKWRIKHKGFIIKQKESEKKRNNKLSKN